MRDTLKHSTADPSRVVVLYSVQGFNVLDKMKKPYFTQQKGKFKVLRSSEVKSSSQILGYKYAGYTKDDNLPLYAPGFEYVDLVKQTVSVSYVKNDEKHYIKVSSTLVIEQYNFLNPDESFNLHYSLI